VNLKALSRCLLVLAAFFCLLPGLVFAQQITGNVEGVIQDTSGAVIGGAEVTITNQETGQTRNVQSTEEGFYFFRSLNVGKYSIKVTSPGFRSREQTNLVVTVGSLIKLDFELEIGNAASEIVTVTAEATWRQLLMNAPLRIYRSTVAIS
jgi:hypothetical protein